jgi:hypothetical protein
MTLLARRCGAAVTALICALLYLWIWSLIRPHVGSGMAGPTVGLVVMLMFQAWRSER